MKFFTVDLNGFEANLPVLPLPSGVNIAFFNLHGNVRLTEHCGKQLAKLVADCDVLLTAESKGLQLTHVIASVFLFYSQHCGIMDEARSIYCRRYHSSRRRNGYKLDCN